MGEIRIVSPGKTVDILIQCARNIFILLSPKIDND